LNDVTQISTVSQISIRLRGKKIPGAEDRQQKISGFDQRIYSRSKVLCIGAGGLISHIAPTLCRKGIGALTILDNDVVEVSNLNRQFFYEKDIGCNKALAMAENLQKECIQTTDLTGYALRFEEAIDKGIDLSCNVAICGVDNNPTRIAASKYFREKSTPAIFTAVSADGDHGYVFVQEKTGPCFGCLFPDAVDSKTYPCPGTPAIADILQEVGAFTVYAVDTCIMQRRRRWNYRHLFLGSGEFDSSIQLDYRQSCGLLSMH
jgi:molybdopterin/thiamine biosynthesis adenylyltransferase